MFKPYRKNDVSSEYTKVEIPGMGSVWAKVKKHPVEVAEYVTGYYVEILGYGDQSYISLNELPKGTRDKLLGKRGGLANG